LAEEEVLPIMTELVLAGSIINAEADTFSSGEVLSEKYTLNSDSDADVSENEDNS
jgi:hypothetical protein